MCIFITQLKEWNADARIMDTQTPPTDIHWCKWYCRQFFTKQVPNELPVHLDKVNK